MFFVGCPVGGGMHCRTSCLCMAGGAVSLGPLSAWRMGVFTEGAAAKHAKVT
jgi:hypothetical protein